ncbi:MAG: DNA mismatch repair endonuclease MutL [Deltaproteobacteria bacterium]|uniref:DNA mismatch repair protein MutL n=1 Tax=Candidatus Zymogenus saltonus TaxID=2844893 RepID=A0A9D8PNW1_9DELT|nr:DNA mismatch repair endonuclease MutL [Candidatus Zymogenus saltonus]
MAAKIKLLDTNLVNLIAAGEIVERPASVVKELIENSLDAGANSINVEVVLGGKRRIVVIDDGDGMSREDAELSLMRHATSKIAKREDLTAIHTLGFRGEAVPSIASVSRFKIFTRERGSDQATEISVDGGKLNYIREAGAPPGTRIVVEDLFFSVPARRKFLKTDRTEYYHIMDVVNGIALSRPDVRFTLSSDGREVINTLPGTLRERAGDILGRKISERMEEIAYDEGRGGGGRGGIGLVGLMGSPDDARSNQSGIYLYVNDRFVKDRVMVSAIVKAYRGMTSREKYPTAVLFLQLPFSEVDVNIHPTKTEVKFRDSGKVYGIVKRVVDEALLKAGGIKIAGGDLEAPRGVSMATPPVKPPPPRTTQAPPEFRGGIDSDRGGTVRDAGEIYYEEVRGAREKNLEEKTLPMTEFLPPEAATPPESGDLFKKWGGLTLLGQIKETYIVFENVEGLLIVDQHAAHERVVYERLKAGAKNKNIPMQQLLFPLKLELPTREYEIIVSNIDRIKELGLELSDFGAGTVIVSSIPGIFEDTDLEALVVEMAEELKNHGSSTTVEEALDRLLVVMSCHGAVRAGKRLEVREIKALLDAMETTPHSSRCPHGRPTIITIPVTELERRFKRTT